MKVITKQVEIERTVNNEEIENSLKQHGDLIRWAVVKVNSKQTRSVVRRARGINAICKPQPLSYTLEKP